MDSKAFVGVLGMSYMSGIELLNKLGLITERLDSTVQVIVGLVTIYMLIKNKNKKND